MSNFFTRHGRAEDKAMMAPAQSSVTAEIVHRTAAEHPEGANGNIRGFTKAPTANTQSPPYQFEALTNQLATDPSRAEPKAVAFVRTFLADEGVQIRFNNELCCAAPRYLTADDITLRAIADEMKLRIPLEAPDVKKADVDLALRKVIGEEHRRRRKAVMAALMMPLSKVEKAAAEAEWQRIADVFHDQPQLTVAVLQHFMWQVKRKHLDHIVKHHLMPVVSGPEQGSGKTTFVRYLLAPLQELATVALLSDFTDARSAEIYRYLVVFIDDMERSNSARVPVLKTIITGDGMQRRRLGTSMTDHVQQRATLIGTTNNDILSLIPDETGHRRFATLTFRNGASAKGGDERIWDLVRDADYTLLWRSVDAAAPSPIEPQLTALAEHQARTRPVEPLRVWLTNLNLDSEAVRNISTPHGVKARGLFELYLTQTNSTITERRFADDMQRHVKQSDVPFGPKYSTRYAKIYPIKRPSER